MEMFTNEPTINWHRLRNNICEKNYIEASVMKKESIYNYCSDYIFL